MKKCGFFLTIGVFLLSTGLAKPETPMSDYSNVRIQELKMGSQAWTFRRFSFFETLDQLQKLGIQYLEAYPGQVLDKANPDVKFDHHLTNDQILTIKKALDKSNIKLVNYGVVTLENDEASMREVFDFARKMQIQTIVTEPQYDDFSLLEKMVKEYGIKVAIHNYAEPSKYAYPETVLKAIKGLDIRIGACADIGHWMRSGVDVLEGLRMLRGRIYDVHFEDLDAASKDANTVPFGQGAINIRAVLAELTLQNYDGILAIELEQKEVAENPGPTIREGIKYVDSVTYYKDWEQILGKQNGKFNKDGWNHNGLGYFTLDRDTGVLTSHGGSGLFWYSPKKYRDFILELDFKCSDLKSNSGIFLRVPGVPVREEDYTHHSFEVQINDAGKGIHKTGGIYDAAAPTVDASNPTGEWNHYRITFKGKNIQVELNGQAVLDWDAKPSGKIADFAEEGYIGLQNHDRDISVSFRNIFVKELE
ncbi:MAG: DUF1080 domain-containing protein [Candidatus Marinimicrobia bacterium]|nr:DUF1080 domain-containing protein [Candidatus Neomarinimicrobiota bacterium]